MSLQYGQVLRYLPDFLLGAGMALWIALVAFAGGLVIGLAGAAVLTQGPRWARIPVIMYVRFFTYTPQLVQIFFAEKCAAGGGGHFAQQVFVHGGFAELEFGFRDVEVQEGVDVGFHPEAVRAGGGGDEFAAVKSGLLGHGAEGDLGARAGAVAVEIIAAAGELGYLGVL